MSRIKIVPKWRERNTVVIVSVWKRSLREDFKVNFAFSKRNIPLTSSMTELDNKFRVLSYIYSKTNYLTLKDLEEFF